MKRASEVTVLRTGLIQPLNSLGHLQMPRRWHATVKTGDLKFKGRGQKETSVGDIYICVGVIMLLPGKRINSFLNIFSLLTITHLLTGSVLAVNGYHL